MDALERTAPQDAATYDAFVSYSHAADDLLAPRLQAGLQQFAKPWWKRRALRIFRDESSLSANPHLWSSITDALDESAWFVLLLSPDAARSEWVNQEIEYWLEHKDRDRIIPVLTDGEFGWSAVDVAGDAVPSSLQGVFSDEPRWVDLRFARDDEQLDLKNPRFSAAVADIGSAIRGVPKDELESEEVKQHRRTVRTAWGAGVLVLILGVVAGFAAVQASLNAADARRLAEAEAEARADAVANAEEAETQRDSAEESAAIALRNASLARARELAASAISATVDDAQLGLLLALQAIDELPKGEAPGSDLENALRTAMAGDRLLATREVSSAPGGGNAAISPDSSLVLVSAGDFSEVPTGNVLEMLDAVTFEPIWSYAPDTDDVFFWPGFSSDGDFAYLSVWDRNSEFVDVELSDTEGDARIVVFDTHTGEVVRTEVFDGACQVSALPGAWRSDLGLIGFGVAPCSDEFASVVRIVDAETWETVFEWPAADHAHAVFADHAPIVGVFTGFNSEPRSAVFDTATWEPLIEDLTYAWGDFSPDGTVLAGASFQPFRGINLVDIESGQVFDRFVVPQHPWRPMFSPAGDRLAIGSFAGLVTVVDPDSGETLNEIVTGRMDWLEFTGSDLFTTWEGDVYRWDGSGTRGGDLKTVPLGLWVNGNSIWWSEGTVAAQIIDTARDEWFIYPVDPVTGSLGDPLPDFRTPVAPLTGGRVVYLPGRDVSDDVFEAGPLQVVDLATGDATILAGCWMVDELAARHSLCPDGAPHPAGALLSTGDKTGNTFMIMDSIAEGSQPAETWASLWDSETLREVERFSLGVIDACCNQLWRSKYTDRYVVLHNDWLGSILGVLDRSTGEMVEIEGEFPVAPIDRLEHDRSQNRVWFGTRAGEIWILDLDRLQVSLVAEVSGDIRAMATSPLGDRIAIGTPDDTLRVFSDQGELLHQIPITNPSDGWWLDDDHVVVGTANGPWTTITLDTEELLDIARSRVRRGFTQTECEFYNIDPCPPMEEVRGP